MLPHNLPELPGKTSKDASTINKALKYVTIAAIAICTLVVSVLFVKLYVLQAEPSLHNKVAPIEEEKESIHKDQDQVYFVGVDIEFEHPTTITPTLKTKICEPVNQESSEDKNNNIKQKVEKKHLFQSVIPASVATESTSNVEIAKPIEKSHIKNSNLNQNPLITLWPSFNFSDGEEQKVNNERKNYDNTFEQFYNYLFKPTFDSEDTNFSAIIPIDDHETFLNFPSYKPNFNSYEEITPIDSSKEGENSHYFSKPFLDFQEERSESTTTNSNESKKPLESPIVEIKSLENS